jgi:hypothetical protein
VHVCVAQVLDSFFGLTLSSSPTTLGSLQRLSVGVGTTTTCLPQHTKPTAVVPEVAANVLNRVSMGAPHRCVSPLEAADLDAPESNTDAMTLSVTTADTVIAFSAACVHSSHEL